MEKIEGPNTKKAKQLLTKNQWNAPQVLTICPKLVQGKPFNATEYTTTDYTSATGPS